MPHHKTIDNSIVVVQVVNTFYIVIAYPFIMIADTPQGSLPSLFIVEYMASLFINLCFSGYCRAPGFFQPDTNRIKVDVFLALTDFTIVT